MSEVYPETYFDELKRQVKRLAKVLAYDFPWVFNEGYFEDLIEKEIELARSSNLAFEDEDCRIMKLNRIRCRLIAFCEAIRAFHADASELSFPEESEVQS